MRARPPRVPGQRRHRPGRKPTMALYGAVRGPRIVGRSCGPDALGFDRSMGAIFGAHVMAQTLDRAAAAQATQAVPGIPCDAEGPVFREPWEAQAFAMALALHERDLFTWNEWAATLGEEIKRAQAFGDPDTGETYYRHWLAALERLVAEKGVASRE